LNAEASKAIFQLEIGGKKQKEYFQKVFTLNAKWPVEKQKNRFRLI
jgi:hypothetical protein